MGLTMGYRGKVAEREEARALRAHGLTMLEIATKLGVSKSSVSLWTRDVEFVARPRPSRRYGARRRAPNALQRRKAEEIERLNRVAVTRLGVLSDQAFLAAGAALYAGEGGKGDGAVVFANSDPAWSCSSAAGCADSSTSMRAGFACACTCIKAWTSMPPSGTGPT
jgi:transcriptional regulator with XRE-family HTH domain